jgi:hypothetical protein
MINRLVLILMIPFAVVQSAYAGGKEDFNDCRTSTIATCVRSGSCAIQGSAWYQHVTIDVLDRFDTQGWPGLCDMTHVSLVQGTCSPLGAQENVTADLSETTHANIPAISGSLACGGENDAGGEICDDFVDNDDDGKIDCADRGDCRRDSFCR